MWSDCWLRDQPADLQYAVALQLKTEFGLERGVQTKVPGGALPTPEPPNILSICCKRTQCNFRQKQTGSGSHLLKKKDTLMKAPLTCKMYLQSTYSVVFTGDLSLALL